MIKTLTFAVLHFSVAFSVAYLLTGSIGISSTVALVEPVVNTVVFFFHEKAWQRIEARRRAKRGLPAVAEPELDENGKPKNVFSCGHML